jgi:hypothetical protein
MASWIKTLLLYFVLAVTIFLEVQVVRSPVGPCAPIDRCLWELFIPQGLLLLAVSVVFLMGRRSEKKGRELLHDAELRNLIRRGLWPSQTKAMMHRRMRREANQLASSGMEASQIM